MRTQVPSTRQARAVVQKATHSVDIQHASLDRAPRDHRHQPLPPGALAREANGAPTEEHGHGDLGGNLRHF